MICSACSPRHCVKSSHSAFKLSMSRQTMRQKLTTIEFAKLVPDLVIGVPMDACGIMEFQRAQEKTNLGHERAAKVRASQAGDGNLFKRENVVRRVITHDRNYRTISSSNKTKQVRNVPIPAPLVENVRPLVEGRGASESVFLAAKGEILNHGWFRKAVLNKALSRLGWRGKTTHGLRPTS